MSPKISIITVVYNGAAVIEKTILNVQQQTYTNIEHIIVDGASKDDTLAIVKKYPHLKWISERDKGLYDAMNKGIKLATGDYLWFMNAGDLIYAPTTAEQMMKQIEGRSIDVLYGETVITDMDDNEIGMRRLTTPEKLDWKSFQMGMLVCHQSILVSKKVVENYNTNYRLAADIDWVIRILKKTNKVHNTHLILSKFQDGGLSKKNIIPGLKERFHIMRTHYGLLTTLWKHLFISLKFTSFVAKNKRI